MQKLTIPEQELAEIEKAISSDQSVVGIDAKKTHVIIIHLLQKIDDRLNSIEKRLNTIEQGLH